jgi:hypothetical protein
MSFAHLHAEVSFESLSFNLLLSFEGLEFERLPATTALAMKQFAALRLHSPLHSILSPTHIADLTQRLC